MRASVVWLAFRQPSRPSSSAPARRASETQADLGSAMLYYVCEDVNGVCMYRRRDVNVPLQVTRTTEDDETIIA